MIEKDTVRLLRECDAGVKMGVSSINEVLDRVKGDGLRASLVKSRDAHERLGSEIRERLDRFGDDGKEPSVMSRGMSWIKTEASLLADESDATIASLMTDGCNMGIKSLNKYLNEYEAAEEYSKDITKKLISLERELVESVKGVL